MNIQHKDREDKEFKIFINEIKNIIPDIENFKSLMYKPNYVFNLLKKLNPSDFRPRPKANIVFVEIKKKIQSDIDSIYLDDYFDFLSYLFSMSEKSFKEKTRKIFSYDQQKMINNELLFDDQIITRWTYNKWLNLFDRYIKYVPVEKKSLVKGYYNKSEESKNRLEKLHRNRNKNN